MQEKPTAKPQTVSELYPSKYLSATDLQGKIYTLTIVSATVEKMRLFDGTQGWRVVLAFAKTQKVMVLNKTQCRALSEITGSERVDSWKGLSVRLSAGTAQNGKPTILIHRVSISESQNTSEKPVPVSEALLVPQPTTTNGYHD